MKGTRILSKDPERSMGKPTVDDTTNRRHALDKNNSKSNSNRAVVASLTVDRSLVSRQSHPFSSLALSPGGRYALVAGKGTIQLVALGGDPSMEDGGAGELKTIRSLNIAHQFSNTTTATSAQASRGVVANSMNLTHQQYENIVVTKIAWSNKNLRNNNLPSKQLRKQKSIGRSSPATHQDLMDDSIRSYESLGNKKKNRRQQRSKSIDDTLNADARMENFNFGNDKDAKDKDDSFVAAAGSNGVVLVWSAKKLLFSDDETKRGKKLSNNRQSGINLLAKQQRAQQPEGILTQHTRSINGMAWHPTLSGLLLTASQDGTIKLWERKAFEHEQQQQSKTEQSTKKSSLLSEHQKQHSNNKSWFSMMGGVVGGGLRSGNATKEEKNYFWSCKTTFFLGEQDAVRDIRWNKYIPELFGVVTSNGNLVVYNMHVTSKALVKIAAHTGDAASLDWHPRWPYVVATGGSSDRFVKIWDLEILLDSTASNTSHAPRREALSNDKRNTQDIFKSDTLSVSSNETLISSASSPGNSSIRETIIRSTTNNANTSTIWVAAGNEKYNKSSKTNRSPKHVLSISASVTQVRWRPPSNDYMFSSATSEKEIVVDRHDTMLAVATARQTSAGGSGTLSLWSFHRPFMSLSIVEGHEEGAVSDFVWVKTPLAQTNSKHIPEPSLISQTNSNLSRKRSGSSNTDNSEKSGDLSHVSYVWQNILSVGRDGKCIIQSFARGERRIHRVPSSCFTMANLSPFQQGYGSLQFCSVYQDVPNRPEDDFMLTGLRQDNPKDVVSGVVNRDFDGMESRKKEEQRGVENYRFPRAIPKLRFSIVDQGSLDAKGMPIVNNEDVLYIAPEVLHMSRFARLYKLYPDKHHSTRVELCLYNSKVAEDLKCRSLARMWNKVSNLLHSSGLDELTSFDPSKPTNAFQFVIFRTIKSLLLERAEAGDVQTNVALCEVLQVVDAEGEETRIPGLRKTLVREWYLYYIDLLHQMSLFSAAAFLIKHSKDPAIGALSQQSTTIHESCPRCGKPIDSTAIPFNDGTNDNDVTFNSNRQVCKNCRVRVGMCFICHEPVTGIFVWCPGCGHGGHLEHALQWFGGLNNGKAIRRACPTGCGHKCNLVQIKATAFPRTDSMVVHNDASLTDNILSIKGHQPKCMLATT